MGGLVSTTGVASQPVDFCSIQGIVWIKGHCTVDLGNKAVTAKGEKQQYQIEGIECGIVVDLRMAWISIPQEISSDNALILAIIIKDDTFDHMFSEGGFHAPVMTALPLANKSMASLGNSTLYETRK
uniref:Uncharacterized protein n=1 Tax=Romanomermis culicivorax TaxID=13658 RepID=A0A915K6H3_ROMCU